MPGWMAFAAQALLALFGGGGAYSVLKYLNDRKKIEQDSAHSDADTARILNSSALSLLAPAREQVDFLRRELVSANVELLGYHKRVTAAEERVRTLSAEVQVLTDKVRELVDENDRMRVALHPEENHD